MTVCKSPGSQTRDSGSEFLYMIMDSGPEEQAISHVDWRPLGEPSLRPSQVRLRSATGDNMGVIGSISVHVVGVMKRWRKCLLWLQLATTKSVSSASKIFEFGLCEIEMKPTHSALHHTERTTACHFEVSGKS